jgi:acetyl esterase/lipase
MDWPLADGSFATSSRVGGHFSAVRDRRTICTDRVHKKPAARGGLCCSLSLSFPASKVLVGAYVLGMARGFYLTGIWAAVALGLLTIWRCPDWMPWKLSLLAGECGYALVPVVMAVAVVAGRQSHGSALWRLTLGASALLAVALLAKPCLQALTLGPRISGDFRRAFPGSRPLAEPSFSVARLFVGPPETGVRQTIAYADHLALDLYRAPSPGAAELPCVIAIHGGGWNSGERDEFGSFYRALASRGYAVAAISYRLAPGHPWPAQRDDVLAAVSFLKAQAGKLGIDPTRLVLFGRSAGGQIAEAVGYSSRDPAIRGVIAFYAPADMDFAWRYARADDRLDTPRLLRQFLGGDPSTVPSQYRSASGFALVAADSPPTLLLHGELDPLVWYRQSERLAGRLAQAGVPCVLVSLPWATHAFEFSVRGPGGQVALRSVEQFLVAVLGP